MKRTIFWMLIASIVLGLAATGCTKKGKKGAAGDAVGDEYVDQVIIGYDENGNPIYGSPDDLALPPRDPLGNEIGGVGYEAVYFDYDSDMVPPAEGAKVDAVAQCLQQNPNYGVIVEGNCDERGATEYNLALGEKRAGAVRSALIGMGIDGARIQTRSYGEDNPQAQGHDEASWRINRRADFVFTE